MDYDIIIIGGGPSGISCAIEAKRAGLSYVVLEKGVLVNSIFNFPANMTFFSTSLNLEIGDIPFISHNSKPTRREALEYYRRVVEAYEINIKFRTKVVNVNGEMNNFSIIEQDGNVITSKFVIVATGFYDHPRLLNVPGENLPKVKHYYDEVHHYIQQDVVVIGAANSACDVALECWEKGANVTMVVREDELYENVKYWILPNIKNRIAEGSIKAHFNSHVTAIREKEVDIQTPSGSITIDNDYVLAMIGYVPDYKFFKELGIQLNDQHIPTYDKETLESNRSGLFLAGVILGGDNTSKLFIENTRKHGRMIIETIQENIV